MADGDNYVSTSDVYRTAGITSTEVPVADVLNHILSAELLLCRYTKNIYYKTNLLSTATSATTSTLVVSTASWTTNLYSDQYVAILSGTGKGQYRKVLTNTGTALTVDRDWTTIPAASDTFKIFYVPSDFNPYQDVALDGNGQTKMFTPLYPVRAVESLTLNSVSVSPSNLYIYNDIGKLQLKSGAEASRFGGVNPQDVEIKYWYGVDKLGYEVKRFVELRAAIQTLVQQMGGTFDDPSMITLPDFSVSIGQAYINIEGAVRRLQEEYDALVKSIKIYPTFAY